MYKKFISIITLPILFFYLTPTKISYSSINYNENNCNSSEEKKEHNLNDERELLLIKKNIIYLSDKEKEKLRYYFNKLQK